MVDHKRISPDRVEVVHHRGKPFHDHVYHQANIGRGKNRHRHFNRRSTLYGDAQNDKEVRERISKIFSDQIDKLMKDAFTKGMS